MVRAGGKVCPNMGELTVIDLGDDPVVSARHGQQVAILHPCCDLGKHNKVGTVLSVCGCCDSQFVCGWGVVHQWRRLLNHRVQGKGSRDGQVGVVGHQE